MLLENPEGRKPIGIHKRKLMDNIKNDLEGKVSLYQDRILVAQDKSQKHGFEVVH
jgi:hypothetical protein